MRRIILALVCMLVGAQVWGATFDEESRKLGDLMRATPFNEAAFSIALAKSHLGEKENIDYRSYKTATLLVQASYLENLSAMKIIIDKGANIEQIVHKDRGHDLITVLLSEGKFIAAAYLYNQLPLSSINRRDTDLDKEAETTGFQVVKARAYTSSYWKAREQKAAEEIRKASKFDWASFLKLVLTMGASV